MPPNQIHGTTMSLPGEHSPRLDSATGSRMESLENQVQQLREIQCSLHLELSGLDTVTTSRVESLENQLQQLRETHSFRHLELPGPRDPGRGLDGLDAARRLDAVEVQVQQLCETYGGRHLELSGHATSCRLTSLESQLDELLQAQAGRRVELPGGSRDFVRDSTTGVKFDATQPGLAALVRRLDDDRASTAQRIEALAQEVAEAKGWGESVAADIESLRVGAEDVGGLREDLRTLWTRVEGVDATLPEHRKAAGLHEVREDLQAMRSRIAREARLRGVLRHDVDEIADSRTVASSSNAAAPLPLPCAKVCSVDWDERARNELREDLEALRSRIAREARFRGAMKNDLDLVELHSSNGARPRIEELQERVAALEEKAARGPVVPAVKHSELEAVRRNLSTLKGDLDTELEEWGQAAQADMGSLRAEIAREIGDVKAEQRATIATITDMRSRLDGGMQELITKIQEHVSHETRQQTSAVRSTIEEIGRQAERLSDDLEAVRSRQAREVRFRGFLRCELDTCLEDVEVQSTLHGEQNEEIRALWEELRRQEEEAQAITGAARERIDGIEAITGDANERLDGVELSLAGVRSEIQSTMALREQVEELTKHAGNTETLGALPAVARRGTDRRGGDRVQARFSDAVEVHNVSDIHSGDAMKHLVSETESMARRASRDSVSKLAPIALARGPGLSMDPALQPMDSQSLPSSFISDQFSRQSSLTSEVDEVDERDELPDAHQPPGGRGRSSDKDASSQLSQDLNVSVDTEGDFF